MKRDMDDVQVSIQSPIFFPGWQVKCTKCEDMVFIRCECVPVGAQFYEGPWEDTHADDCGLPERCPKCGMRRWTLKTKWRRGYGTSRATIGRRKLKEREEAEKMQEMIRLGRLVNEHFKDIMGGGKK